MRILQRVGFWGSEEQRSELASLGVRILSAIPAAQEETCFLSFDLEENQAKSDIVRAVLRKWGVPLEDCWVRTEFTAREVRSAKWLRMDPTWHHGYPQPDEEHFGYLEATYDLTEWCDACGVGSKQKAPFQMKGEPKWGKKGILQLNWVFDEYFAKPELVSHLFSPFGIESRPVTNRKGLELKTVVQLVVEEEVDLFADGLTSEVCAKCARRKYLPVVRGLFPPLKTAPHHAMARTREVFGSGCQASNRIIVSQALAKNLVDDRVQGISFWPVQSG